MFTMQAIFETVVLVSATIYIVRYLSLFSYTIYDVFVYRSRPYATVECSMIQYLLWYYDTNSLTCHYRRIFSTHLEATSPRQLQLLVNQCAHEYEDWHSFQWWVGWLLTDESNETNGLLRVLRASVKTRTRDALKRTYGGHRATGRTATRVATALETTSSDTCEKRGARRLHRVHWVR